MQSVLHESSVLICDLLKNARDLTNENSKLRQELKSANNYSTVELQKVAGDSSGKALNKELVERAVSQLVDAAYIDQGDREKVATALATDPNNAFGLVEFVVKNASNSYSEGRGVRTPLDNSIQDSDPDGWNKCI